MDLTVIYSKTPKGLRARSSWIGGLSSHLMKVLSLIDGKSTVEAIIAQSDRMDPQELQTALSKLENEGYIRPVPVVPRVVDEWAPSSDFASMVVEEIHPAEAMVVEEIEGDTLDFSHYTAEADAKAKADAEEKAHLEAERAAREKAQAIAEAKEQSRLKAEAESHARAEAQARQEAERKARMEAEAREMAEAAEKARLEAERIAREEALVKAKAKAEEAARLEAEEKARIEAEEAARREMERIAREAEEARLRSEAEARERAEEEARLEEERKAQAEAEEKARLEAERIAEEEAIVRAAEEARLEAEHKAREEAEDAARREAEQKAQAEAEERSRLEAERIAREEAEAKARAEEEARLEAERIAEAEARAKAAEEARLEAERVAREKAEAKARLEAEEKARKEAERIAKQEEKAAREAEKKARKEAEKQAKEEAKRIAQEDAETKARLKAEEKAVAGASTSIPKAGKWISVVIYAVMLVVPLSALLLVGLLHVMNLTMLIKPIEKLASESLHETVTVHDVHASLWPRPHLVIGQVMIGDMKIESIHVSPVTSTFFKDVKILQSVEIEGLKIEREQFDRPVKWISALAQAGHLKVDQINLKVVFLNINDLVLGPYDGKVGLAESRELKDIELSSADRSISMRIAPQGGGAEITLNASNWSPSFAPRVVFDELKAVGVANPHQATFSQVEGKLYGGSLKAGVVVNWSGQWSASGNFNLSKAGLPVMLKAFESGASIDGDLDLAGSFACKSSEVAKLTDHPDITASFDLRDGRINGIDLVRTVLAGGSRPFAGEATRFDKLAGSLQVRDGRYQFKQLVLEAAQLHAKGNMDILPGQEISGSLSADLATPSRRLQSNISLAGKVGDLKRQ